MSRAARLTEIRGPTTSTSQFATGVFHSFASISRILPPFLSRSLALIRNGPPSDSGAEIEITLSPFISINAPVILAVSVPATISGRCGPISNGPKEKPNSLARGCNAQRLTVSLDSAPPRDPVMAQTTQECNPLRIVHSRIRETRVNVLVLVERASANDASESTSLANKTLDLVWDIASQTETIHWGLFLPSNTTPL